MAAIFATVGHNTLTDGLMEQTIACPAAGATANSAAIHLFPGRKPSGMLEIGVDIPALAALTANDTLTVTIQDSADGLNFAAVASLNPIVLTGDPNYGGAAAYQEIFPLPVDIREYVRLSVTKQAGGGNDTGVTLTMAILS